MTWDKMYLNLLGWRGKMNLWIRCSLLLLWLQSWDSHVFRTSTCFLWVLSILSSASLAYLSHGPYDPSWIYHHCSALCSWIHILTKVRSFRVPLWKENQFFLAMPAQAKLSAAALLPSSAQHTEEACLHQRTRLAHQTQTAQFRASDFQH